MTTSFELPLWHDLHVHFRQGDIMPALIKDHLDMGCSTVLAMPNTKPPVAKVRQRDDLPYWSVEGYRDMIMQAGGDAFDDVIVPLYLTKDTTPAMIEDGAKAGLLKACKYYPPHGTTGADFGYPFEKFIENGVFAALQDHGVTLCIHGEEHGMEAEQYFDRKINAEEYFYQQRMPKLADNFPRLKVVGEHLTTKVGVDFIQSAGKNFAASVTPQHLIYTVGHLLKGLNYHLYCLPLVKYDEDRAALRAAVSAPDNTQFFAGTDSAPHVEKLTACGCAAGCYTGGIAPQLYAEAFEMAGVDLSQDAGQTLFSNFITNIGGAFYGLPTPQDTFTFVREPSEVCMLQTDAGTVTPLPKGMSTDERVSMKWSIRR